MYGLMPTGQSGTRHELREEVNAGVPRLTRPRGHGSFLQPGGGQLRQ